MSQYNKDYSTASIKKADYFKQELKDIGSANEQIIYEDVQIYMLKVCYLMHDILHCLAWRMNFSNVNLLNNFSST